LLPKIKIIVKKLLISFIRLNYKKEFSLCLFLFSNKISNVNIGSFIKNINIDRLAFLHSRVLMIANKKVL